MLRQFSPVLVVYNRGEPHMQEDRRLRRAKLAQEIPRRRHSLSMMNFTQDRLPSPMRERHATLIQQWTEELEKMEAEYHELNVELIREELKGEQSDR
jgi:hypothetical protein